MTIKDIQEDIIKAFLSVDNKKLSSSIQYGLMINPGLIDLMIPSIELLTGINFEQWKNTNTEFSKWTYKFDWLVPTGYSLCIDHRNKLGVINALQKCIHLSSHYKFEWDLCQWYYDLYDDKKKGLIITGLKDIHLENEINWLRKGIKHDISIVEIPNTYNIEELYKSYQLSIYESIDFIDKVKIRSNIMYYLSHPSTIEKFRKDKTLNINNINKY